MIGYNRLGSNGRLGNQMFQYASLRGIAAARNYDWKIPPEDYEHKDNYGLFETFEMSNVKPDNLGFVDGQNVQENDHCFIPEFLTECPDNSNLEGYFQTEKYFEKIADQIHEDFTFKKGYLEPCKEYIESLDKPPIFLHIRQSDNIGREQYHPILPVSFFDECLKEFPDDTPCFVFTDDLEWCREQFTDDRFLISTENPLYSHTADTINGRVQTYVPYYDMCLMSLCSHAIMANSSMSWWGAWLIPDKNKKVIAPKAWFGSKFADRYMDDLYPDGWIVL